MYKIALQFNAGKDRKKHKSFLLFYTVHKYNLYRRISSAQNTSLFGMRIELFRIEFRPADQENFQNNSEICIYMPTTSPIHNNYAAQT